MICPNCRNQVVDEADFCPSCGTSLKELKENSIQPQINIQQTTSQSQYKFQQFDNNVKNPENKKKSSKSPLIIILIIISIIIVVLGCIGFNYFSKKKNVENNNDVKEEVKKYNTFEKLKSDYEAGILSVSDYFTQLVYLEFDSSKLNSKYDSDYEYYSTECELNTDEILEMYYDKLDQDIVKLYLTNKSMANIILGEESSSVTPQSNNDSKYEVKLLKDEKDVSNAANHRLNKVHLSSNGHFLIWYASYGDDAITDEQLKSLSDGLESSISKYEQYFGISYSYNPYIDNQYFNDDWKNAKEVLTQNNISTSVLQTAMSVYVYDTGSETTLASYNDEQDAAKWINRSLFLDILDEDGIINYPYIIINKKGISKSKDSLVQLYNHELFHHMQYLFCKSTSGDRCIADLTITEGMANFASSKVSNVSTTNNFLNNWAGIYTKNTSTKLSDIVDGGGSVGYALFTYFYSYSTKSSNWAEILMNAHNEKDPFTYIQNNTTKQDLISTINDLAYNTISQSYDNKSLISNKGINNKLELKDKKSYNLTINEGSIDYFVLNSTTDLSVSTNNNDYLTIKIYGYKDGVYKELKSSSDKIEVDTAFYVKYDKFYLVVTNGDLTNSYNYTINLGNSKYVENSEYVTTFNNYNIEITMNTKVGGIEVKQYSKGIVDELHQKEYLDFDTTTMGITVSNKIYYDFNTGYTYMTQPYGGDVWWKEKGTSQIVDLGNILDKLISMENVTKVSDNHYKVKMTKNDIKGLMSSANSDTSAIKGDVNIDVYTENGYIVKLDYDFTKMVSGFELFTTTIKFSNYDNAGDVEIPQTIIDNAKNM